jgi:hypothetical protein
MGDNRKAWDAMGVDAYTPPPALALEYPTAHLRLLKSLRSRNGEYILQQKWILNDREEWRLIPKVEHEEEAP